MPYSKDIRCGEGWFNTNIAWFYQYLDEMNEELIVKTDCCESEVVFHTKELEEKIEEKVNDYISWKVFGQTRNKLDEDDRLPEDFEPSSSIDTGARGVWAYVYHHICLFIRRKPTWYELESTLPEEEEEEACEQCKKEDPSVWVKVEDKVVSLHDECQEEFLKDKPSATVTF
jgi:hypothetical protein